MDEKGVYLPTKSDLVSLGGVYTGIVLNVYYAATGEWVVKVFLVKNAFQRGAAELHTSGNVMGEIRLATREEVMKEIAHFQRKLKDRLSIFHEQIDKKD